MNIPTVRNYTERHVFEHVYRGKDGKLYRPKRIGAVVFPSGPAWGLHLICGVRYVTQSYNAKAFRPLANVEADKSAAGGVILLTARENLPLHAFLTAGDSIAKRQVQEAINAGEVAIENK
jgi:hypothetical protein